MVALPCRVGHADRKGKVESAVGHTQATPLKGLRFESLEEAQAYLDRWDARWADTRLRRQDRLLERRVKQAGFRDVGKRLDTFDFEFNKKMNRALVFELATGRWITQHADALFLGPPGSGKSHLAQAIGFAVIQQDHRALYREAHLLLEELAEAQLAGTRKAYVAAVTTVPLLIIDDLGMRKLPHTAAEDLLEIVMRRYERTSTLLTSNRPVEDWGKLLGDTAAVNGGAGPGPAVATRGTAAAE
jgi:DNA replication protein DnaC